MFLHVLSDWHAVLVEGSLNDMVVDTGVTITVVRPDILSPSPQHSPDNSMERCHLTTVTGETTLVICKRKVILKLGDFSIEHDDYIAEIEDECLLGLDVLCRLLLQVGSTELVVLTQHNLFFPISCPVVCGQPTVLPASSKIVITDGCQGKFVRPNRIDILLGEVVELRTLVCSNCDSFPSDSAICLEEGAMIDVCKQVTLVLPNVPEDFREKAVSELLQRNRDAFSCGPNDLGRTNVICHHFDTGDARPKKQSPRRLPLALHEAVKGILKEIKDLNVIEPSVRPWSSSIVLVKKKDGSLWFCVDYHQLKNVTMKDSLSTSKDR
ncbi:hypothetical protein PR048_017645 [Dryococelus australis]|uniref:Uncharacterized protein n=1 Tax=Dryococelus australis TaxID=614101 RepID=A0ABQ9HA32_9NEOP|nr:hypothetical protein PR048_017645 [Dryococelus australis]